MSLADHSMTGPVMTLADTVVVVNGLGYEH